MVNFTKATKTINLLMYRFRYLINYIIIGILSIIIELIIINGLNLYNINFTIVIIIGFLSGVFFAFVLNARLNFNVPKSRNVRTFIAFLSISVLAFILNLILINMLDSIINISYGISRIISAGAIFLLSYTLHRKITFDFIKKVGIAIYLNQEEDISKIYSKIKYYADFIHIDLIDKTINPDANTIDYSLIKKIDETWALKKMLHIMSKKPSKWINYLSEKVDIIVFHFEIDEPIEQVINLCRSHKKKVGLAIKIETKISEIEKYLIYLDFVQIMGIKELGKSGQNLDLHSLEKLNDLNKLNKLNNFEIIFDGGVKPTNVHQINAKYIVSSSGLLKNKNPIESFMKLKTSSRYYSVNENIKEEIKIKIKDIIENISFIKSGTFVGSFAEKDNLSGISDIDIVLILDKLTKEKFDNIINKFEELKLDLESTYGHKVIINTTFGPIKFNENNIVFHLMIYDTDSHKDHCIQSPFTCFDWQRSDIFVKKHMKDISKIHFLQPSNFINSRRSITDYSNDLKYNKLTYREYEFKENKVLQIVKDKELDDRHRIEFSEHIIKFLMLNIIKLIERTNNFYSFESILDKYFKIFPKNKQFHKKNIINLERQKNKKIFNNNLRIKEHLEIFIKDFEEQFKNYFYNNSKEIYFIRHQKTNLNNQDIFIGQKQDPDIIKNNFIKDKEKIEKADVIFSSPSKRCLNTLKILTDKKIVIDDRLKEINYGDVDGKDLKYLSENFPKIIEEWDLGLDPRFPNGENYLEVVKRLRNFINYIQKNNNKNIAVCTHNVIIRALIGISLKIHYTKWHKINIPYAEPIKFILTKDNRIYIELEPEQAGIVLNNL